MSLIYKFKKEKLKNGIYVSRPKILVRLHGKEMSIDVPALIDSGCDTTVIPEGIAKAIGLKIEGKKDRIYAYRESNEVICNKIDITFLGRAERESIKLTVPILISLSKEGFEDEEDIVLGVDGIFDAFDITFKKFQNKIILKRVTKIKGLSF